MSKSKEESGNNGNEAKSPAAGLGLIDKAKNFVADKIAEIPKPEANVDYVEFKGIAREGVTYHAKVSVKNPYPNPLPVCELKYQLNSAGGLLMSGNMPDPGSLPGRQTTQLDVPMVVPHTIIYTLAKDIARDWDIDYDLEIGLIIDLPVVGNLTIPLHSKGEIKLPTVKDFFKKGEGEKEDKSPKTGKERNAEK